MDFYHPEPARVRAFSNHYLWIILIRSCSDGHDTSVGYAASWLTYWLLPLLNDTNFNTASTLILLTFDEYVSSHCIMLVEF